MGGFSIMHWLVLAVPAIIAGVVLVVVLGGRKRPGGGR